MSFIAVGVGVGAVGSVVGGVVKANAASSAAERQAAAAEEANKHQSFMWNEQKNLHAQGRADLEPWKAGGQDAFAKMGDGDFQRDFTAGDFQQDPGYQFRMAEGQKALERSAAARGGLQSGGMMKALSRYGQGVASEEYGNAYNRFNADRDRRFGRLSQMSGQGLSAASSQAASNAQLGNAGMQYATNLGNNIMGSANAQGAAGMAQADAIGGAISGVGGAAMDGGAMIQQGKWLDKWSGSGGGGSGAGSSSRGPSNYRIP